MGRFEFRKHEIELDIAGMKASVPDTMEYVKKLEESGKKMEVFGAQMAGEKDVEKGIDFMLDILDDLLGEDVMDTITAERTLSIYDCLDLVTYISKEVQTYHTERANSYKKPVSPSVPQNTQYSAPMAQAACENRAARRARQRAERRNK